MAVNYGQVAIVPKGVWNAETQYKVNNLVEYDGSSYVAKVQPPAGTLPTDTSYWQVSAAGTKKATADSLGTVMPDGTTTEISEDGKLSAKTAQQNALGVVKGSDDVTVGEDGKLSVNTAFEQATEIANIIAGEAIKSVLGKVSKAIATTMSLDENALLKNMISGIDVNSSDKVPSSAYIHTLVERIGMGTDLDGEFANLTAGLNSVNNNLSNYWSLYAGTEIPANADMHDYKTPGNYYHPQSATVKSLLNCPMDRAFQLKVVAPIGNSSGGYIIQEYIAYDGSSVVKVHYDSDQKKWINPVVYATKDDLGNFLVASGTKASVYKNDVDITSLKLYAGHTYLVLGNTSVDDSVSLISSRIVGPTSDYGIVSALGQVRTTGSNGGGCMTASIISLTKDFTITLCGYGYDNSTYNYIGNLIAIQLK